MVGIVYNVERNVDAKDRKILKTLFEDGRMSIVGIAKKTGLQRYSVARRIKKMRAENVLTGIIPVVNPTVLGFPNVALILLKLKTLPGDTKDIFVQKLVANRQVVHVSDLLGKFDVYCAVVYKDTNHLNELIQEVRAYIPDLIDDFELLQVVNDPKFEKMDDLL